MHRPALLILMTVLAFAAGTVIGGRVPQIHPIDVFLAFWLGVVVGLMLDPLMRAYLDYVAGAHRDRR